MKKIKLPLEMANGVMVRSLDELKENWDLEKVVEHFVTGKLTTWLNDRYYTDLAEKVENLPKDGDGRKLQQALCRVFEVPCEELELDVDEIAERKRRQDLLRQYTSDDEVFKNVDKVAFDQEDLAYLLDDEIDEIYLFNNKFTIPLTVEGKKYIGVGDNVVAEIRSKKPVNFVERGIAFSNVKFDEKYAAIHKVVPEKPKFSAKVGDIITLGKWNIKPCGDVNEFSNALDDERKKRTSDGTLDDVEWKILVIENGRALVVSKYCVDNRPYNNYISEKNIWSKSSLRNWLNTVFYEEAFSSTEKDCVVSTAVADSEGGGSVNKIWILTKEEIEKYMPNWCDRICLGRFWTCFGCKWEEVSWHTRSPGPYDDRVLSVSSDGGSFEDSYVKWKLHIRPAMWVDLSKM